MFKRSIRRRSPPRRTNTEPKAIKPWKRNLLRVPDNILAQIAGFGGDTCVVSCAKKLNPADIHKGIYDHLGIHYVDGKLHYPSQIVPAAANGRYSTYNRYGREIVHADLPKTQKSWDIDTPNYGDWSKGSHTITYTRDIYQRTDVPPKLLDIKLHAFGQYAKDDAPVVRFTVDEVLDRTAPDFQDDLLFCLNLLQENVGTHGIYETDASRSDYLKSLYVNWEILPAGESEHMLDRILSGIRSNDPKVRAQVTERYNFLRTLRPQSFIRGTNGFRNYFGALFADDLVVFENVEYGNAIYVMFEDWAELSKKSRVELLALSDKTFVRIPHGKSWEIRLHEVIRREMLTRK